MKKYSLILTKDLKKVDRRENLIGIVPMNLSINSEFNFEKINFPDLKKDEIKTRYENCKIIFDNILSDLTLRLNKLHNITFSERSWNIILGTWLNEYIQIFYKIYSQIDYIKKNYNLDKIYTLDFRKFDFSVEDTHSFRVANAVDEWYYLLFSKIVNNFFEDIENITKNPSVSSFKKKIYKDDHKTTSILKSLFNIQDNLFKKIINYDNHAVIINTALPLPYEKLLQLKVNLWPFDWPEKKIIYKNVDYDLRAKIKLNNELVKTKVEKLIRENINIFIPKFAVENFSDLKKIAESKIFPQNPKFIFTSTSYAYDECFKIYAAIKSEKRIKYFVGQHGHNYFTRIHHKFLPELNFADSFVSWGYDKSQKLNKKFNFKTIGKNYKFNDDGNLVIYFPWLNTLVHSLHSNHIDILNEIKTLVNAIKKIDTKIKKKTILRFNRSYFENFFGIVYFDFFKDLGFKCDDGSTDVNKLIKKSKLNFFTYDSTGVLENLNLNIPTIFLNKEDYKTHINDNCIDKYNLLHEKEIMFLDENKLVQHINTNWYKISNWWNDHQRQLAMRRFNDNFNIKASKNSINDLRKDLI